MRLDGGRWTVGGGRSMGQRWWSAIDGHARGRNARGMVGVGVAFDDGLQASRWGAEGFKRAGSRRMDDGWTDG